MAFVDLARSREPSELLTAIAETLGLRDSPAGPATEQLQRYVENRQMLLLLDNFEHLLNAASDVSNLLSASDRLTLLVTSREPLHLRWEHQFAVRPLALPRLNQELSPEDLGQVASVALFVERTRATQSTLQDHARQRANGTRDLPPFGWPAVGDRARRSAFSWSDAARTPGPTRASAGAVDRRRK